MEATFFQDSQQGHIVRSRAVKRAQRVDIEINPPRRWLPLSATQQRGSNPLGILPTRAVNSIRGSAAFPLLPIYFCFHFFSFSSRPETSLLSEVSGKYR